MAECPPACQTVWSAFVQMALSRPPGMGFAGIPASEIEAWQRIHRVALTAWEVDMIHELDKVAAKVAANDKKGGAHDDA